MTSTSKVGDSRRPRGLPLSRAQAEVGLIWLLFFVYAGGPPPDANEAHYLGKARHYWDPDWCRGDFFLESGNAHWAFFVALGWLTRYGSLGVAAWIGRCLAWALLAVAWRQLSQAIVPQRGAAVLSAGLLLAFSHWCHLSGEWLVGGIEGKSIAYGFVVLALARACQDQWRGAWPLLGLASAFHVLVGGWVTLAVGFVWLCSARRTAPLATQLPGLSAGAALAALGLVPVLTLPSGAGDESTRAATIYVYERLSHHLVLHTFAQARLVSHAGAVLVAVLAGIILCRQFRTTARTRLLILVGCGLTLSAVGAALDVWGQSAPDMAAKWLRFYWFRLADFVIPAAAGLFIVALLAEWRHRFAGGVRWVTLGMALCCSIAPVMRIVERQRLPIPRADRQTLSSRPKEYREWLAVCRWIHAHTPTDAMFITPRRQQTFKWHAQRAEVVSWKDVPQDGASLVEWQRRLQDVFPRGVLQNGLTYHSDAKLLELAHRFGASHLLFDTRRARRRPKWRRLYPPRWQRGGYFEVYQVPASDEAATQRDSD